MSNINKTSLSAVISDFVDNINENILNGDETLNSSPASFTGTIASTLGKISAYSFYNMLMAKRELMPSTAILMKSLLNHLQSDQLAGIYATPSKLGFILSYSEDAIISAAVPQSDGTFKLTLNKGTEFYVGNKPTFTLDYNIDIIVTKYNLNGKLNTSIYAKYNTDDPEVGDISEFKLANSFITTRNDVFYEGTKYFTMYLDVKQYSRQYNTFDISGESKSLVVEYSDELVGFVVLYRSQSTGKYVKCKTYVEGSSSIDGVSYSLQDSGGTKTITLKFSKLPDAFNPTNGSIKVVTYTTKGSEGNFKFDDDSDESVYNADLNVSFTQDLSDPCQEALVNLIPSGTLKDVSATGGSDAKTIEDVRSLITQDISSEYITPSQITSAAEKVGMTAYKFRHDLISIEYILTSFLQDASHNVIPTKMIDVKYNYDDVPLDTSTSSRIIKPSDVFEYSDTDKEYKYVAFDKAMSYSEFYNKFKSEDHQEYSYPYFMRIQNGSDISVKSYDESTNYSNSTKMDFLNLKILDKASIVSASVYRNPLDIRKFTLNNETKYLKDFYTFNFTVNTSSTLVTHLKNLTSSETPYMKIRLVIKNKSDSSKYVTDVDLANCDFDEVAGTIVCRIYLETDSNLLSTNKINIVNNSLTKLPYSSTPYSFYFVDGTVDAEIAIIFKNSEDVEITNGYSEYINKDTESDLFYYVGMVYSLEDITLSKDMSNNISILPDLKLTQPEYQFAEEDIPDVYTEDVFKMSNGKYVVEDVIKTLPDGSTSTTQSYVKLHKAGDIKKENDGRVGTYNVLSSNTWNWSDESSSVSGIYNDGSVLGNLGIHACCQWNGLVIFAGEDGRVGCYDSKSTSSEYGRWYAYNSTETYRDGEYRTQYVIRNDGSAMNNQTIRGMRVLNASKGVSSYPVLIVYGDNGYVASCDLSSNTWRKYNGDSGNSIAIYYNNGNAMGGESIYASETYTVSNKTIIVFAGGSGRVCSFDVTNVVWYGYNHTGSFSSPDHPFSDGTAMNFKSIMTISKYLSSILYMSGINGVVSSLDITTGRFSKMNDGSIIDNVAVYCSAVINGVYIIAGKGGKIASYNIAKNVWTTSSAGSGLCSDGYEMGNSDVNAIVGYDVNVMFAGGDGKVSSFDIVNNVWTLYNESSGLRNDGSFIKNTVSCVTFDSSESNIIYFAGKAGNVVYKYRKGDIMRDANGLPIVKSGSKQIGYLNSIPAYSRIFAISSKFNEVISGYSGLLEKIATLSSKFPDGCSLFAGVKTTSGKSTSFYFKNLKTGENEYLDDLAISLKFGVKFSDSLTDTNKTYLVSSIKETVISYIQSIQKSSDSIIEISMDDIIKTVKDNVPNIKYIEFYGLNNYSPDVVQTIIHLKSTTASENKEYLSVKNEVDEANSDIDNMEISLIPAIDISIL